MSPADFAELVRLASEAADSECDDFEVSGADASVQAYVLAMTPGTTLFLLAEVERLQRENAELRESRDIAHSLLRGE